MSAPARQQLLEREQEARAIAEAANRSKDEFLAMLGHELRNPLGAIANGVRLLEAPEAATRAHARDVIARQVQHLARMTDDLLANAVRYTPAGATITVSVAREGADAVLRVADEGVGMPRELVPRVFEPFVQGDRPLDRSHGGLGIGLTLVRRLAELHGGSAAAASEGPGLGSVFTVRLPAIDAPARSATPADAASTGVARRILVVEDNADARETLKRLLERQGHTVRAAADGAAALELLNAEPVDVALIDIGLPGMDGYELARRIRTEIDPQRRRRLRRAPHQAAGPAVARRVPQRPLKTVTPCREAICSNTSK